VASGIDGADAVKAALLALVPRVEDAAAVAVEQEAEQVAADMKGGVPVVSGELQDSIGARQIGPHSWVVETLAEYATAIEWGKSSAPAQPFATPAAERSRARFPGGAARVVKGAVK